MPSDPKFDDYLFELRDLMHAKGYVITINNIIVEGIHIHKLEHCHDHNSNQYHVSYDEDFPLDDDDVEHGDVYYATLFL